MPSSQSVSQAKGEVRVPQHTTQGPLWMASSPGYALHFRKAPIGRRGELTEYRLLAHGRPVWVASISFSFGRKGGTPFWRSRSSQGAMICEARGLRSLCRWLGTSWPYEGCAGGSQAGVAWAFTHAAVCRWGWRRTDSPNCRPLADCLPGGQSAGWPCRLHLGSQRRP